jgi:ADP-ribose pyrophosphatase YjhB (NUDIX family)
MTTRQFCRFNRTLNQSVLGTPEVPEGGLCLSCFLVIIEANDSNRVLMGRINPDANWDHIGALDKKRAEMYSKGWMLPSSHLMLLESPQEASKRVLREQLVTERIKPTGPIVVSETYGRVQGPPSSVHWDIHFIFKAFMHEEELSKPTVWTDLRFVDLGETTRGEITRSHDDILKYAGLSVLD